MRPSFLRLARPVFVLVILSVLPAQPQQPPAGSTVLLPSGAFPGGVLTGVVIGPDDQPVPNTPVNIAGGVPITLTGVVLGEEPTRPTPDHPQPCRPDASGNLPPGCPPERPQPDHPAPCQPDAAGNLPPGCAPPAVSQPLDCANVLKQFGGTLAGQAMPQPGTAASPTAAESPTAVERGGPQVMTDAAGRFAMCIPVDAPKVDVALPGMPPQSVPSIRDAKQAGAKAAPPSFFQPGDKSVLIGLLRQPTMEQGGHTWLLPAVNAWSPSGDQVITAFQSPRDLQPGPVQFAFTDRSGNRQQFTGGVFKTLSATLDRSKLRSQEGADFSYTVQFGDSSVRPCVNVSVIGPVVLTQAPPPQIPLDASGVGRFAGKIRATQVAPGAAIPFDIVPDISDCGLAAQPAPQGGEPQPGAAAGGAVPPSVANLHAAPAVPNPWAKQGEVVPPPPAAVKPVSPGSQVGSTPLHTMDETSKLAKMPPPIPVCTIQFTAPAISNVTGVNLLPPRTFTQQQGLNYYHIQGCNFGDVQGHVYLVFPPANGQPGFGTNVELYLMQGAVWGPNSLDVFLDPNFGGFPDEVVTLQVVTAKGLKAELPNCKFRAERKIVTLFWFPRSQVKLGSTPNYFVTPVFHTTATSQTDSLVIVDNNNPQEGPVTATVNRTITNVGGPFTVQDDLWDFSKLQPGFVVQYATPYYDNWNGQGCDQTTGHWGTSWDSATLLRVHVQGCFHQGTGYFRSSAAFYGLGIQLSGPKGTLPWPMGLK